MSGAAGWTPIVPMIPHMATTTPRTHPHPGPPPLRWRGRNEPSPACGGGLGGGRAAAPMSQPFLPLSLAPPRGTEAGGVAGFVDLDPTGDRRRVRRHVAG